MIFLLGRLLNTLSYKSNKEIRESLYKNEYFLQNKWNFIEQNIVLWSSRYIKYNILTLLLAVLVVSNLIEWLPLLKPHLNEYLPSLSRLPDWQKEFLAAQLTVVGAIYPLVIGLIGVLLQNKSAKSVIFLIYQKYSGFMFSGLSGLSLSAFILVGYLLQGFNVNLISAAFSITSSVWFLFNIALTAWFFAQTLKIINDRTRDELLIRFSICESCEYDIKERIKQTLMQDPVHFEMLTVLNKDYLRVDYLWQSDNCDELIIKTKLNRYPADYRLRLVNLAIQFQTLWLKFKKTKGAKIYLNPVFKSADSREFVVARYVGLKINPISMFLLRHSVSFRRRRQPEGINLSFIIDAIVGSAFDALRDKNTKDFTIAIDNVINWHKKVALATTFINREGKKDNWLLLSNGVIFSRNNLMDLLSEYYDLARDSAELIPINSYFYRKMLNLHQRISAGRSEIVPAELRELIGGSYHMWSILMEWKSFSSTSIDIRVSNKYEDVLYDFVGTWEEWPSYVNDHFGYPDDLNWRFTGLAKHLELTALTSIAALRYGNIEAAGWGVDMLNNWYGNLIQDDYFEEEYSWRSNLINPTMLLLDSEALEWKKITNGREFSVHPAFGIAFKNASLDVRVLTACYILLKPQTDNHSDLARFVNALLTSEAIHKTGAFERGGDVVNDASTLLGAYFRHRDYVSSEGKPYSNFLTGVLSSFGRINEERQVAGRIYSGWGAASPRSMHKAYVEIGLFLSERPWLLANEWQEVIESEVFDHETRDTMIYDLRDLITTASEKRDYALFGNDNVDLRISNFRKALESIVSNLEKIQFDSIKLAPIDDNRLVSIGEFGSTVFNNLSESVFPLNLFERINKVNSLPDNLLYQTNIHNYEKKKLTSSIPSGILYTEEFFSNAIRNQVKKGIYSSLIRYPILNSHRVFSIESVALLVADNCFRFACPILFICSRSLKSAIRMTLHDVKVAESLKISRIEGFGKEYICHIDRCEVYEAPVDAGYCVLTSRELFDSINLRQLGSDRFVDASFTEDDESPGFGVLNLKFWMEINFFDETDCIKISIDNKYCNYPFH